MPEVVVISTPREGKLERCLELLREMADAVQLHEPETTTYQATVTQAAENKQPQIIMIESYVTQEALDFHKTTEHYHRMNSALEGEGLLEDDMIYEIVDIRAGFSGR